MLACSQTKTTKQSYNKMRVVWKQSEGLTACSLDEKQFNGRVRGEGCNVGGPEQLFNTHSQNYSTEHQCFLDPIKKIFLYNYNSPYDHASILNMLPLRLSNSKFIEKQLHYFVCILRLKLYAFIIGSMPLTFKFNWLLLRPLV